MAQVESKGKHLVITSTEGDNLACESYPDIYDGFSCRLAHEVGMLADLLVVASSVVFVPRSCCPALFLRNQYDCTSTISLLPPANFHHISLLRVDPLSSDSSQYCCCLTGKHALCDLQLFLLHKPAMKYSNIKIVAPELTYS